MAMTEYENQMFLDLFHEDGLLITARGLGIGRILQNFLKLYCDPGNLVLVLNTNSQEEEYFIEQLESSGTTPLPRVITSECSVNERQSIYLEGGVRFVTSRILVVDLLTDRLPVHLVTGILVFKAHKIIESCQEAFILRLYRQKNKKGFIKAFSDSPVSFTAGFCHVERVMKTLFIRKLFLWPRFHANVVTYLDKHKPEVVELHLQMSPAMVNCQSAILDLIDACIKEMKRCNVTLDTDEITVENAITKSFDKLIRWHLDPVWHQLSAKTKQLVSDVKTLRLILRYLTQYDCVTFYSLVNSIRSNEKTFGQNSGWLFLEAADSLYVYSRERIFRSAKSKKQKKDEKGTDSSASSSSSGREESTELEECPKWKALADVLEEIEKENAEAPAELGPGRVLIAAEDDRTCSQLKEYLCNGSKSMLDRLRQKFLGLKAAAAEKEQESRELARRGKGRGKGGSTSSSKAVPDAKDPERCVTEMLEKQMEDKEQEGAEEQEWKKLGFQVSSPDAYYGVIESPVTVLHPLHGSSDSHALVRTLEEVGPRYVVLYDADMVFVRQLEVYKASRPGVPLRVYFLMYTGSTEEQRFLTTLRKEKEAFEYLIKAKGTMVIPEERDGKLADDPSEARETDLSKSPSSGRKAGGQEQTSKEQQKVIVDMREFRSELPSLIHRRGMEIEPVTIDVGDYIITPDMCVERKSVSDLIGSLNNGRLYNQCVSMNRYYKKPVLLIEFDPNKSFALQGKYPMSGEISFSDITSKLTLLTIHFPRLRILWCQSPYATAELFEELKMNRPQPDAAAAMAIAAESESVSQSEKYSHSPQDMLLKMPGINSKNYQYIMNKVEDMAHLITLSEEKLAEILGSSANAKLLYEFLHKEYNRTEMAPPSKPVRGGRGGFRGAKRKR